MFNLVKLIDVFEGLVDRNEWAQKSMILEDQCAAHRAVLAVWQEVVRLTGCPILWEQLVRYQLLPHIQTDVPALYSLLR